MHCPQCHALLPPDAPAGLCPACLLQRGLEPNTLPSGIPNLPSEISNPNSKIPWTPPTPDQLAPFFPDLDTLSLLGRGGMGAVYKARQKSLDRIIALKILPPQLAADPSFPQRFAHEAQALARLNHPHIVTIYDYGQRTAPSPVPSPEGFRVQGPGFSRSPEPSTLNPIPSLFFLSMEYIDGLSLRQLLNASRLDPTAALAIVPQICDALQYAHDRGIVHRDIKPENILLTQTGQIKIADFGLAKLMKPIPSEISNLKSSPREPIAGTPAYMAPEQSAAPETVDHRADLYALGVVFYQMLTGELPKGKFEAPSKKVHLDIRLDEIVLRALEKEPALRYQSATQFKTEVETVASTPRASAAPPFPEPRMEMRGFGGNSTSNAPSLRPASIALRTIAAIHLALCAWPLLAIPMFMTSHRPAPSGPDLFVLCIVILIFAPANLFIFRAGQHMANHRHYAQTLAGVILSMLFIPLGLVAGLWSLILLLQPETRAAFDSPISPPPPRGGYAAPSQSPVPLESPRLSRTALLGACWIALALLAAFWLMILNGEHVKIWRDMSSPEKLGFLITETLLIVGTLSVIGAPILGLLSLSQIRRSNGRLYGLPLALFDALLFPLLLLDFFLNLAWTFVYQIIAGSLGHVSESQHIALLAAIDLAVLITCIVADIVIIRWAWRSAIRNNSLAPRQSRISRLGVIAALGVCLLCGASAYAVNIAWKMRGINFEPAPLPSFPSGIYFVPATRSVTPDPFHPRLVPLLNDTRIEATSFTHTLPSGITVQLVGISQNPSDHAPWWRPDGSPLPTRPYDHIGGSVTPQPGGLPREFLIHLTHLPPRPNIDTQWQFEPSVASAGGGPLVLNGSSRPEYSAIAALVPSTPAALRFGVASGPWKTLSEVSGRGDESSSTQDHTFAFAPAYENNGHTLISVAHDVRDQSVRLIALDAAGHEYTASRSTSGGFDATLQLTATFDLPLDKIHSFQFQSRPYEWTEFKNIAINPATFAPVAAATQPDPTMSIKLKYAEQNMALMKARYDRGLIDYSDYLRAKGDRDLLTAELTGNPAKIAQAKYETAQQLLDMAKSRYDRSLIDAADYHQLQLARDLAAAATQPAR